jgi:hypothetical protein
MMTSEVLAVWTHPAGEWVRAGWADTRLRRLNHAIRLFKGAPQVGAAIVIHDCKVCKSVLVGEYRLQ